MKAGISACQPTGTPANWISLNSTFSGISASADGLDLGLNNDGKIFKNGNSQ